MKYAVGIDIGGTNTRIALVDENYTITKRVEFPTEKADPSVMLDSIGKAISDFGHDIVGVGLSCAGPMDLINGKIGMAVNLGENWFHYPIVAEMEKRYGVSVYLENDANLACLAEATVGKGKSYRFVHFLTISTGIGSGYVVDKQIIQGAHGQANEVCNMIMWKDGPKHSILASGALEAISSGTAITNRARALGLEVAHAGEVNDLAVAGNAIAKEIMDDAKEYLANAIAMIFAVEDPDIFILGGSVSLKIEGFTKEVEALVKAKVLPGFDKYIKIETSNLNEDSGLLGAAALAFLKA
ncbi:glucokinase [Breznakia blatticola]|uniref:Glucokinase n=1 Tax=Breznakia blatticola TaxID=1754012 RepID=A0A4R7ZGK3_9FIRM|nr:ROK family protein [Breznakia blatticola]TDW16176.1 glucokinase [Breznakia blatticola]